MWLRFGWTIDAQLLKQTELKQNQNRQCEHIPLSCALLHCFFPQQVRKRHCFAKGVQLVDALEVYNQRKNGELIVHSEKSMKTATFSPQTVSNSVIPFTAGV